MSDKSDYVSCWHKTDIGNTHRDCPVLVAKQTLLQCDELHI